MAAKKSNGKNINLFIIDNIHQKKKICQRDMEHPGKTRLAQKRKDKIIYELPPCIRAGLSQILYL